MRALTTTEVARVRELRYLDGLTISQTAALTGLGTDCVRRYAPGRPGKVDNELLREAFVASCKQAADVARTVGWLCSKDDGRWVYGDGSRVKRTLGILPTVAGHGGSQFRRMIDAEVAEVLAEAIGVAPWEVMPTEAQWPEPYVRPSAAAQRAEPERILSP